LSLDVVGVLSGLAVRRPVFHSERDFQHALSWQIQLASPAAEIRQETRPKRGVHLDVLVDIGGTRTAIELKYLVAALRATVGTEPYDLPHQSANDISRHDVIKDITRIEAVLAAGYADKGYVLVLSNDRSYWRAPTRADTIDAAFRVHEGRLLHGNLAWAARAGNGTTKGRDVPLLLTGTYSCHWRDYSRIALASGDPAQFRYLLIDVAAGQLAYQGSPAHPIDERGNESPTRPEPLRRTISEPNAVASGTARAEILTAARKLADRSQDGSFALTEIIAQLKRAGTRYAESTIRTHVTSRMCADAPDHHGTTYDDFERLGGGRYRFRRTG